MIVAAGGVDCLARPGERSEVRSWNVLATAGAETVVVMPCGLYADEAAEQAAGFSATLESLGAARIVAVDAASTFSRPGPRLADGVELLGHLLHPDRVPAPDMEWRELGIGG
jgi:iron complex transport system substrate-binding protein